MTTLRILTLVMSVLVPGVSIAADQLSSGLPGHSAAAIAKFSSGFIRPVFPYDARVSQITGDNQTTGNKRLLGSGDQMYLELYRPEEISPGDLFTVYRRVRKVYHPERGNYLGDLTAVIGVVKVLKITQDKATARIIKNFDAIVTGDGALKLKPAPEEPAIGDRVLPDGTGLIVELSTGQTLVAQNSIVYVDWGREDGLRIGDRLEVFRVPTGLPTQVIGELRVIGLEGRTATTRVVRSVAPMLRGDRFAFKETSNKRQMLRRDALFDELSLPPKSEATKEPSAEPSPTVDIQQDAIILEDPASAPPTTSPSY